MQDECARPASRLASIDVATSGRANTSQSLDHGPEVEVERHGQDGSGGQKADENAVPLLLRLPPELLDTVLDHIPPADLQRTALALLRVLPPGTLSDRHLWKHLVVRQKNQLMPLWQRLKAEGKRESGGAIRWVDSFSQEGWQGDVDILNK